MSPSSPKEVESRGNTVVRRTQTPECLGLNPRKAITFCILWACYSTPLGFSFPLCKMEMTVGHQFSRVTARIKCIMALSNIV